jgi:hypothetical protein
MTAMPHGLSRLDQFMKACLDGGGTVQAGAQTFGRLMPPNPVQVANIGHSGVIAALDDLSMTMRANANADGGAEAGMTFLGQFVDHDVTLDATSALGTVIDPAGIRNVRTPGLDLDCVYGDGPEASPHLYGADDLDHHLVFGRDDNPRDLARTAAGKALIGDPRNDENVIVAAVQGLFIELHNILMSQVQAGGDTARDVHHCAREGIACHVWNDHVKPSLTGFEEVRRFIRLHYQWIVWNELLDAFVDRACLDNALDRHLFGHDAPVMPVEFSGAAYRFGHATTQFEYRLKPDAEPVGLFETRGFGRRPESGNLDLDIFFQTSGGPAAQSARPVGPKLGAPLFSLPFVQSEMVLAEIGETLTLPQSQNLAMRNMIRDRYTYQLVNGERVAAKLGTEPVETPDVLRCRGITKTPLWFYALQEAETHGRGKLTGAGGAIVATVFANLLKRDPASVLHVEGFRPWSGFGGHPSCIGGIVAFVEANRHHITDPEKLRAG